MRISWKASPEDHFRRTAKTGRVSYDTNLRSQTDIQTQKVIRDTNPSDQLWETTPGSQFKRWTQEDNQEVSLAWGATDGKPQGGFMVTLDDDPSHQLKPHPRKKCSAYQASRPKYLQHRRVRKGRGKERERPKVLTKNSDPWEQSKSPRREASQPDHAQNT